MKHKKIQIILEEIKKKTKLLIFYVYDVICKALEIAVWTYALPWRCEIQRYFAVGIATKNFFVEAF